MAASVDDRRDRAAGRRVVAPSPRVHAWWLPWPAVERGSVRRGAAPAWRSTSSLARSPPLRRHTRAPPTGATSTAFVDWAGRLGRRRARPGRPPHAPPLPRLPRPPGGYARRTIARKASARSAATSPGSRRTGSIERRPGGRPVGARGRDGRLPRVLRDDELDAPARRTGAGRRPTTRRGRVARATTPCSSCSTAAACGSPSCAACAPATSTWPAAASRCGARAPSSAQVPAERAGGRRPLAALAATTGRARARRRPTTPGRRRVPQPAGPPPHAPRRAPASSTGGRPRPPTPTPCATPSPPIFSTAVPTCVLCRSCSATPTWRRPSSTPT